MQTLEFRQREAVQRNWISFAWLYMKGFPADFGDFTAHYYHRSLSIFVFILDIIADWSYDALRNKSWLFEKTVIFCISLCLGPFFFAIATVEILLFPWTAIAFVLYSIFKMIHIKRNALMDLLKT